MVYGVQSAASNRVTQGSKVEEQNKYLSQRYIEVGKTHELTADEAAAIHEQVMSELKAQGANETRFTYGASRSRVYRFSTDGTDDKTTYYLGLGKTNAPLYEVETNTTTNEETHLHFIYAGGYHGGHPFILTSTLTSVKSLRKPCNMREELGLCFVVPS